MDDTIYFIGNISILQLLATTFIQNKHDIHALHIIQYEYNMILNAQNFTSIKILFMSPCLLLVI